MADDKKPPEKTTGPSSKLGPIPLDHFSNDIPSTPNVVDPKFHNRITEMLDEKLGKPKPKK